MNVATFIGLYEEFLDECRQKGWAVEILLEEGEKYLSSIKNDEGMEVQFHIEVDFEDYTQINDTTKQGMLNYSVIRPEGEGDSFAKEVVESFQNYLKQHSPKLN